MMCTCVVVLRESTQLYDFYFIAFLNYKSNVLIIINFGL